jgi:hypothetical protein
MRNDDVPKYPKEHVVLRLKRTSTLFEVPQAVPEMTQPVPSSYPSTGLQSPALGKGANGRCSAPTVSPPFP